MGSESCEVGSCSVLLKWKRGGAECQLTLWKAPTPVLTGHWGHFSSLPHAAYDPVVPIIGTFRPGDASNVCVHLHQEPTEVENGPKNLHHTTLLPSTSNSPFLKHTHFTNPSSNLF